MIVAFNGVQCIAFAERDEADKWVAEQDDATAWYVMAAEMAPGATKAVLLSFRPAYVWPDGNVGAVFIGIAEDWPNKLIRMTRPQAMAFADQILRKLG